MAHVNHVMAGSLRIFRPKGKLNMPKTQAKRTERKSIPIDTAEAAEILSSAISYCQQAGILVQNFTLDGVLWLSFPGLSVAPYPGGGVEIKPANGTRSDVNGTKPAVNGTPLMAQPPTAA